MGFCNWKYDLFKLGLENEITAEKPFSHNLVPVLCGSQSYSV